MALAGGKTKAALFTMWRSLSARAARRASLGQEALRESHVFAVDRLGGTDRADPYNLKIAASRALFGRNRIEARSESNPQRILDAMNASPPLANLITLGARDLPALRDFYRTLGWPQIMDDGEFVAFELRGIVLALFPLAQLAHDGNTEPEPGAGGIRFTIGVQVDSADEVDRLTEQMRAAGARVTKEPVDAEFFAGRSSYLCDPEGNYFEIAWADMPDHPVVIATRRAAGA
ncbi:VOC family protein [Streptomyces sp. NBC_00631]|uniref:VOC family protein n=1 Tax=Streptomyces sp. NBC_00631 TaxID=2975793 RepID=UPI0030E4D469